MMATTLRSEYVGFTVNETSRVYKIVVRRPGEETREFQISIPNRLFLSNRVRYQDAAEICFLKLERELGQCEEGAMPASRLQVTDAELDAYREAHTKKPPGRSPRFKP